MRSIFLAYMTFRTRGCFVLLLDLLRQVALPQDRRDGGEGGENGQ